MLRLLIVCLLTILTVVYARAEFREIKMELMHMK